MSVLLVLASLHAPCRAAPGADAFTLVDQNGRTVSGLSQPGKWLVVYFGYTRCPDACPTALGTIAAAMDLLEQRTRALVQPIFITVDPAHDTPAVLKDYVEAFGDAGIVGLGGTAAQVAAVERAYDITATRHDQPDGGATIDHTAMIRIVAPDGRFAGLLSSFIAPERLAGRLRQLMERPARAAAP